MDFLKRMTGNEKAWMAMLTGIFTWLAAVGIEVPDFLLNIIGNESVWSGLFGLAALLFGGKMAWQVDNSSDE